MELAVYCLATSKSSSRYLNNTMRLVEKPFRAGIWIFSRSVKSYCINLKFVIVNKLSLNMYNFGKGLKYLIILLKVIIIQTC
jgi:hypothetical protein